MTLPILVPPIGWRDGLDHPVGLCTPCASTHWRRRGKPGPAVGATAPCRPNPAPRLSIRLDSDARTLTGLELPLHPQPVWRDLLVDGEVLIKALMRRARASLDPHARRALPRIIRSFDPARGTMEVSRGDSQALSWVLSAMLWHGMSHPTSLLVPTQHPPIGLMRWLEQFPLRVRDARPREILELLAARFRDTAQRCERYARASVGRAARRPCRAHPFAPARRLSTRTVARSGRRSWS